MNDGVHLWVIRSKEKIGKDIWNRPSYNYFARQTSLKNRRYITNTHYHIKWFETRDEALTYFYKKECLGFDLQNYSVYRRKLYVNKKGKYDYFRNYEKFRCF